ncbi:HpcH/HpaI aldolase/citrate lyase family protein [Rhizohabitans arisaemae]|uniref:HpcH/HpaI aldolase/citrate lyase family protein n=1 Tax=Rhizohabitans arisaemae TaxID=2720610 RepID=UPI0024B047DF|nr:CoA ester lyase [Rhizohabitans arisaemae]
MTHPSPVRRLRRSELATPGSNEKMIAKAAESTADLVFLDLEDAVAPAEKDAARGKVVRGLTELDWGAKTRACRINPVQTPWCFGDVIEVVGGAAGALDVVIVPKVRGPRDVWFVDDLLTQLEARLGLPHRGIGMEVLIEEVEALARVDEIAAASPRLEALILGFGDLSADQGMRGDHVGGADQGAFPYPGDIWHYARCRMVVAARTNGIDAIDGPYAGIGDPEGYRASAVQAAALGAVGKWCVHPGQLPIANEVFAPTRVELDKAVAVMAALREAEENGLGAAVHQGSLIDAAARRIHETVIERARRCGMHP